MPWVLAKATHRAENGGSVEDCLAELLPTPESNLRCAEGREKSFTQGQVKSLE